MKKFEKLGKNLSRAEQKLILGGDPPGDGGTCGTHCNLTCKGNPGTPCAGVDGTCSNTSGTCYCLVVC